MALSRPHGRFTLVTYPCHKNFGCVLLQEPSKGPTKPIGYSSRSLSKADQAYYTKHRECLPVVWAVQLLRPYLEDSQSPFRTDKHTLRWTLNMTEATGKLERWQIRLPEFDLEFVHHAWGKHQTTDEHSRWSTTETKTSDLEDKISLLKITTILLDVEENGSHPPDYHSLIWDDKTELKIRAFQSTANFRRARQPEPNSKEGFRDSTENRYKFQRDFQCCRQARILVLLRSWWNSNHKV